MNRAILSALLGHWRRNPLQLFTLLAGLALGTALWAGVQAINAEARASYGAAAASLGEARLAQIAHKSGAPIALQSYVALRRAGWRVSPLIEGDFGTLRLIGIEPLTAPPGLGAAGVIKAEALAGLLSAKGQIYAHPDSLALLPATNAQPIAAANLAPNTAVTDIGLAQRLLGREGQIDRLILAADSPLTAQALIQIAPELTRIEPQAQSDMAKLTDSFHLNLSAFGLLSFAVGLFIVNGAIGLAFEQRRAMLRSLRALGAPLRRLIALMAVELAAMALLGGSLGLALGLVIAAALLPDVAATLRGLYGAEVAGHLSVPPIWALWGLAIAMGGTALAGAGALWSLARMPLLASAQPQAWARARRGPLLGGAALGLLALAAAIALWGQGLLAGFALLGALLMGGALALPPLLAWAIGRGEAAARGPVAQWFWADSRQQLPALSLALMALLLAMAANVGVSTMVSSFRLTFLGFLDQRLASELYVTVQDDAQAQAILALAREARVDAVLPILSSPHRIAGLPAQVYGARDHATYRDNWRFLRATPDVWQGLARGEGVVINEQLYRRAGLDLGGMVSLGEGLRLPVLGIYGDYGNPIGQVVLTERLFHQQFPTVTALRFGLRLAPEKIPALRASLQADLGLASAAIVDQAALKALSLAVFERTFVVTTALNILTLAVAGFAILMSLLTLAALRLPQLAPVWALGMTRRKLALLDLLRAVVLAALTGALALPLGLALAWALLAFVNVEAFGWRLPMYLFPLDYLRLAGFALTAAAGAAAWPAWRLWRMPPVALLGVFRNDR